MINITFYARDETLTGFKCEGHAGYAEHGKDIVCSAVSAVLIGVVNEVNRYINAPYKISDGLIKMEVIPVTKVNVLMEYALHTLQEVEECYPDNLRITIE